MRKYVCSICGYVYDEAVGDPERGIAPGTKWEDVPGNWVCPLCGAMKAEFEEKQINNQPVVKELSFVENTMDETRELSFGELSALCSNLSKGCEKQYLVEEADLFNQLADYYKSKINPIDEKQLNDMDILIQQDLNSDYPQANIIAADINDRGALRAIVWGEKVTKMLKSLLSRYEKQQGAFLENTHVYVCTICGFIYIGDEVPAICPVCKVPKIKFTEIKRG